MGSSSSNNQLLTDYRMQNANNHFGILSKGSKYQEKYALKTYHTSSLQEHQKKMKYFSKYKADMKGTLETIQMLQIVQQKSQNFCSHDYKINLIYQFSEVNIQAEIRERTKSSSPSTLLKNPIEYSYFGYEDLCNILYTCLSALWTVKNISQESWSGDLRNYKTVFLTTEDILLMKDGAIKIMDPYLLQFESRYINKKSICYSPQKMKNFFITDDQKSAIFELGVVMIKICLLQSSDSPNLLYNQQAILQKLERAKMIYYGDIEAVVGVNLFDIIKKMVEVGWQQRFSLQEAIQYAQEMYEQIQNSQLKNKNCQSINHSQIKKDLINTNQSSKCKKQSIEQRALLNRSTLLSPRISNFTIEEVPNQNQEQSSMLESLKVQHHPKQIGFASSVGNAGIFNNVVLNDSYAYQPKIQTKVNLLQDEGQLFTDPELLKTIKRQLQQIEDRKKMKMEKSRVIERRDRFNQEGKKVQICNQVYLTQ